MIYKKYKENNFEGGKNIHAFMKSLQNGLIGKKRKEKDKIEYPGIYFIKLYH